MNLLVKLWAKGVFAKLDLSGELATEPKTLGWHAGSFVVTHQNPEKVKIGRQIPEGLDLGFLECEALSCGCRARCSFMRRYG